MALAAVQVQGGRRQPGASMANGRGAGRRSGGRRWSNWAVHTDGWIIEDDYDAEFRYDRDPVGMVQGLTPERVINIGTVSKSLAPTLRLGGLLCPPASRGDRGS